MTQPISRLSRNSEPHRGERQSESSNGTQNLQGLALFDARITAFNEKLRKLSNEARQLRSSAGIITACWRLRDRLTKILRLFEANHDELFSPAIPRQRKTDGDLPSDRVKHSGDKSEKVAGTSKRNAVHISEELQMFLQDIATLLECFSQFPEFADEIPDRSLGSELKETAKMLKDLTDEFTTHAVQRFLFDSMTTIGEKLEHVAEEFIPIFITVGIPTVRCSQEHGASMLQNLSTIATLFSGVTATMLQFSWDPTPRDSLFAATNAFWFTSLVFSISAAVNSLLGLAWTQAAFRSPDHRVPSWVRNWITKSPLAFLVLSIACFFVGLIVFVYASNQAKATSILTAVLSTTSCVGMAGMSIWIGCELWIYHKHSGRIWLADFFSSSPQGRPLVNWVSNLCQGIRDKLKRVDRSGKQKTDDVEMARLGYEPGDGVHDEPNPVLELPESASSKSFSLLVGEDLDNENKAKYRWKKALRRILDNRELQAEHVRSKRSIPRIHLRPIVPLVRSLELMTKLSQLKTSDAILKYDGREGLVKLLEFSPEGDVLVTSSWLGRSFVLPVENKDQLCPQHTPHAMGRSQVIIKQIEWAPGGQRVLMRTNYSITIFGRDGATVYKHVPNQYFTRLVAWLNAEEIISVERKRKGTDHRVMKVSTAGNYKMLKLSLSYSPGQRFKIRGAAISKDANWMLCICKSLQDGEAGAFSEDGKGRNDVILFRLHGNSVTIVLRYPVFHKMSNISLTRDNKHALVSYETKVSTQLWRLHDMDTPRADIKLERTYVPLGPTNFAALPSRFGGSNDELVLRAASDGSIHFWHTYTGNMLYCLQAPADFGYLTAFAWNRGAGDWMLATGNHQGMVYIWTRGADADAQLQKDEEETPEPQLAGQQPYE